MIRIMLTDLTVLHDLMTVKIESIHYVINMYLRVSNRLMTEGVLDYKLATKIMKPRRKTRFSKNMITENPENTSSDTQSSPNLIREYGRTVGSDRVAAIIG